MIIDDVTINVTAGHGGKGSAAFNRNMMSLGPAGGSGGDGGSVYLEGVSDLSKLLTFRHQKDWAAQNGEPGRGQFVDGKTGEDLILKVPVGTVAHDQRNGKTIDITKIGEKVLVLSGGRGGKGNFQFRSPTNTSPTKTQPGMPGGDTTLRLELKLIADIGLVGFPNAGKSSLLNSLTNAKSKVANYQFTTLEPHLGAYYDLLLADIPGLIEGASEGKGLGVKFLRHIERTTTLFHLIAADSTDPAADYQTIRQELKKYNPELAAKPEYVFLSKIDMIDAKELKTKLSDLKKEVKKTKTNNGAYPLSIIDEETLTDLKKILAKIATHKHVIKPAE